MDGSTLLSKDINTKAMARNYQVPVLNHRDSSKSASATWCQNNSPNTMLCSLPSSSLFHSMRYFCMEFSHSSNSSASTTQPVKETSSLPPSSSALLSTHAQYQSFFQATSPSITREVRLTHCSALEEEVVTLIPTGIETPHRSLLQPCLYSLSSQC